MKKLLLTILFLLCVNSVSAQYIQNPFWYAAAPPSGTVTFVAAGTAVNGSGSSFNATSPDCTGSNTAGILLSTISSGGTITSATYNGAAMTRLDAFDHAGNANGRVEVFYILSPSTGAQTVAASLSPAGSFGHVVICLAGVNQTTPFGTAVNAQATTGAPSVTVASATGELIIELSAPISRNTTGYGAGQTEIGTLTGVAPRLGSSYIAGDGSNITMTETLSSSGLWNTIGFAVKPQ